jgi:Holliday junction DNA helicase RuvB
MEPLKLPGAVADTRVANRILRRARDYAQVKAAGVIDKKVADQSLKMLDIDEMGLDNMDRQILLTIIEKFSVGRLV